MTTVTDSVTKRVDQLKRDDWIHADFEDFVDAARVVHVETYPSDSWGIGAILLYRAVGDTAIHTARFAAESEIRMLSEAEIADAMDEERRELIARQLSEVIDLVRRTTTPLPQAWSPVTVEVNYSDRATIEVFAKALGVEVKQAGPQVYAGRQVDSDVGAGVDFHAVAYLRDPTGLAYSREADDPTPVSPARVPLHTGAVTDAGLVDESSSLRQYFEDGRSNAECSDEELESR